MSEITIIIPNYNGIEFIEKCLISLENQTFEDIDVIVVDNGSTDGSREIVEDRFPEVTCIALPVNTGFCGAVNTGIIESDSPYILLLNNDTEAAPEFTQNLYQAIQEDKNIFSVCGKMVQYHHRNYLDDTGNYYCALGWAFARGKNRPVTRYNKTTPVFASCAGAAIYRRDILDQIGYFDENHFAYLEDIDIAYRARIWGFRNIYTPDAVVYHVGSGSSGSLYNDFKVKHSSRNSIYLIYKNMPFLQILINLPFLLIGFIVKSFFFARKGMGKEYIHGLATGIALCRKGRREGCKVRFRFQNLKHYAKIQLELWWNMVLRIAY